MEFTFQACVGRLGGIALGLLCSGAVPMEAQGLSLHEAVQQALRSPQTGIYAAQTDEARGQLRQAGLGLNPRLYLQSEDWRPWGSDFDFGTQTEDYAFLSQSFETAGKRRKRVALAAAQLDEQRSQEAIDRFTLAARVAGAYWTAEVLSETAERLQDDMSAVEKMVLYDQERVDAGAMRGVDLLRMQIERDRLEMALRTTERDAELARLELFRQMGQPPMEDVKLTDPIEVVTPVAAVPVAAVLARRADLAQAREAVAAAQADVKLQRAVGVPNVDLVGGYKRNSVNNTGYGSLQMDLPFRNRNQGEVARAEASVHVAEASLTVKELQVRAEILQSEKNYERERKLVEQVLPDMRAKAKENLDRVSEAYRIGGVDLLRFLDAERTEFDVEVSALRTFADYQQAALRLEMSYGVQP